MRMSRSFSARLDRLERNIQKTAELREINRLRAENSRLKAELEKLKGNQLISRIPIKIIRVESHEQFVNGVTTEHDPTLYIPIENLVKDALTRNCLVHRNYFAGGFETLPHPKVIDVLRSSKRGILEIRNFGPVCFGKLRGDLLDNSYDKFVDDNHWLKEG